MRSTSQIRISWLALAVSIALGAPAAGLAQEGESTTTQAEIEASNLDKVVVTGTRIARPELSR